MIRILNFVCVIVAGLSCLALYHVSERTRVARVELSHVHRQIAHERGLTAVLEAEWGRVAEPGRIQQLAQTRLGLEDATSVQLASFDMLPRRGEAAPLSTSPIRNASVVAPAAPRASVPTHIAQPQQARTYRIAAVRIGM